MEEELHAAGFDPFYTVGTDIRYVDIRSTKVRTAKGFGSAPEPAENGRKFGSRNEHRGIQVDGGPVEILSKQTLLPPVQHTNRTRHNNSSDVKLQFFDVPRR